MSFGWGKSESHEKLPAELVNIITQGWEELGGLRQGLIGQLMGVLTGGGAYEYQTVGGTPGHYETRTTGGGGGGGGGQPGLWSGTNPYDEYEKGYPATTEQVWVPGTGGGQQWVQTGGPNATLPIIQQAEEAQRRQTSNALRQTSEDLALRNLLGTPFGEQTLATQRQQGATSLAGIGPQIIGSLLQAIPGFVQGNASSIMGSLGAGRTADAKSVWSQGGV